MDNNVMASQSFDRIIQEIIDCGFGKGATYVAPDLLDLSVKNLREGINDMAYIRKTQSLLMDYYKKVEKKEEGPIVFKALYNHHVFKLITSTKDEILAAYDEIEPIYHKRKIQNRPIRRLVDFNQGVDARLFTPHMAEQFGKIAISPLRIAFDHIEIKDTYVNAVRMSAQNGIKGSRGKTPVQVVFDTNTFWLSQQRMAELFGVTVPTINYHLGQIEQSGEIHLSDAIRKILIPSDKCSGEVMMYNLDVVIAVGYRVNSYEEISSIVA